MPQSPNEIHLINNFSANLPDAITDLPGIRITTVLPTDDVSPDLHGDAILASTIGGQNMAELLECGARWVQVMGVGVDQFPLEALGEHQILACARGATAIPIGEFVIAAMASQAKAMPDVWLTEAPEHWWGGPQLSGLHGKTLVVVGVGGIGTHIAHIALAFGMRVIGVRRRDLPPPIDGMEIATDLATVIGEADHLALAAPATGDTNHLVDARILAAAKPGLHLINVARGSLVDQDALRGALDNGQVGCATLDTVTPEPLPADSWMYGHPGIRLSPHVSWAGPGSRAAMVDAFIVNYTRFRAGEPLEGVVDRELGY